jgi:hypothetical protein
LVKSLAFLALLEHLGRQGSLKAAQLFLEETLNLQWIKDN